VVSLNNATYHRNSTQSEIFSTLEDIILPESPVRFIDAFVEALSLQIVGFSVQTSKGVGLPSCDTKIFLKIFLKIYLYVYLNVLRSSRKLEKECARNIELQWLLCAIIPYYHNISDFRKQNPSGLKNLFKLFVSFLKDA
jgi:transposase